MPTTYHIIHGSEFHSLRESEGTVISASPVLDWAIALPFAHVRKYCEQKGWRVMPITERQDDIITFFYHRDNYQLLSDGFKITKIMKNDEEITWADLPEALKGLI
jgi:hypothetical protein